MRASTLFGLTIAILIGMAVVFGVKSAGLFSEKPRVVNPDLPKVLVFRSSAFEGLTAMSNDVIVRAVDPSELDRYMKNRDKYMPANPEAANFRVLARNVYANEPLLKEHFKDLGLPESFIGMLAPGMRAVNLQLARERSAGGVIRKGDYVDVLLTTTICSDPLCQYPSSASAPLALGLKVIMKRDSLFQRMEPLDDKPISFTLEANPYRAALIEFAKSKGTITLVPTGPNNNKKPIGGATTNEGKDEERRIIRFMENNAITEKDLEEVFKLTPMSPMALAQTTEHMVGHRFVGRTVHSPAGMPGPQNYRFMMPDGSAGGGARYVPCATCAGGKKLVGS